MTKKKVSSFSNLNKKLKKTSKLLRFLFFVFYFLYFVSGLLFSYSLLLLSGIETLFRILIIIIIGIYIIFFLLLGLVLLLTKKNKWFIILLIFSILFTTINGIGFYYINKTYSVVDNINKENIIYTTYLITLDKNTQINIIGMIKNENDIEGHILPQEYLAYNNKQWVINYYETNEELLDSFYEKETEAIFLTANYIEKYSEYEKYNNIAHNTFVIEKYSKSFKKEETLETSNKDISNPFSILLLGVDSHYDGLNNNALGDSIMLVTFNPKTLSATMFSIPRDTYVPIACNNNKEHRINSAAGYGTACMINTVQNLTGITIDYYMKINFKGVVSLVDSLEGIDVMIPEPDFPEKYCLDNSSRFGKSTCLKAGMQHLDGEHALAFSRVRSAFILSDFKRAQNQQLVVEAIAKKIKNIKSPNTFFKIINTISHNLDTNMSTKQMLNFYNVGKNILIDSNFSENEFINIQKTYLTGYDLYTNIDYTFQYYKHSLNEIVDAMNINLENKKAEIIKNFNFSVKEEYVTPIIGKTYISEPRKETMPNYVGLSIQDLDNWASKRNITVNKTYVENNCVDELILSQSVPKGTIISENTIINVSVCKNITYNDDSSLIDEVINEEESSSN